MSREAIIVAQTCAKCAAMYLGAKHAADGSSLTAGGLREVVRLFADAVEMQATLAGMQQEATQKAVAMTTAAGLPTEPAMPAEQPEQAPRQVWLQPGSDKQTHQNVQIAVDRIENKGNRVELHSAGEKFAVWGDDNVLRAQQLRPGAVVTGNVQAKAGNYGNVLLTLYPKWDGAA